MAIKNLTYRNFIIVMNKIIAKGYDEKTAEDLAHKVFDNYHADKGRGDRSVEWFIGQILTKDEYDIEQKYMMSSASSAKEDEPEQTEADEYRIESVEPCYTGGGIYVCRGKLANGNYFLADDYFCVLIVDEPVDWEESFYEDWQREHLVEELDWEDALQFCKNMVAWVKANEPDGNYNMAEFLDDMSSESDEDEEDEEAEAPSVELEQLNIITEVYSIGDGFFVDVTVTNDWLGNGLVRKAWLYHNSIGVKEMVFGYSIKDVSADDFLDILKRNLYDGNCYIESYKDEYMSE